MVDNSESSMHRHDQTWKSWREGFIDMIYAQVAPSIWEFSPHLRTAFEAGVPVVALDRAEEYVRSCYSPVILCLRLFLHSCVWVSEWVCGRDIEKDRGNQQWRHHHHVVTSPWQASKAKCCSSQITAPTTTTRGKMPMSKYNQWSEPISGDK